MVMRPFKCIDKVLKVLKSITSNLTVFKYIPWCDDIFSDLSMYQSATVHCTTSSLNLIISVLTFQVQLTISAICLSL